MLAILYTAAVQFREFGCDGLNSEASRTHAAELLATKIAALLEMKSIKESPFRCTQSWRKRPFEGNLFFVERTLRHKLRQCHFLGTPFFSYKSMNLNCRFLKKLCT